jgi:hypothetical protein
MNCADAHPAAVDDRPDAIVIAGQITRDGSHVETVSGADRLRHPMSS